MFQTFEAETTPEQGPPRLAALREAMAEAGVDAVLVPRADAWQGEHVAACDARLAWLTGFTGSAGLAAVTADAAALFVDGRYTLQGDSQTADEIVVHQTPDARATDWLAAALPDGARVAYDPWLHTRADAARLSGRLGPSRALAPVANLVDRIWTDRPPPPTAPAFPHDPAIAGRASADKRAELAAALREAGHRAAVLCRPDGIAWLLNLRGGDVPHLPVVQAFAILFDDGRLSVFVTQGKLDGMPLDGDVSLLSPEAFEPALRNLTGPVRAAAEATPDAVARCLADAGVEIAEGCDPCELPKARKTDAEIAATREAHRRDGAAMARFLAWLDATPPGDLTEIAVVERLEALRRDTGALHDISFDTICGSGPNAAIVHYRVNTDSDRRLRAGEMLLVDSGGQYPDGTTDITRTIPLGEVPREQRAAATRVLQGLIAMSRLRWPAGLAGRDIEAVARAPLWMAGADFDHGTGHGVGVFLDVHEGPQRLSRRSETPLVPGMILSNEPGYYRGGAFGVRLENLVVVTAAPPLGDDREQLAFDTLTLAPFDRRLILPEMLTAAEVDWLDAYHADVLAAIAPRVDAATADWLARACAPLRAA